jgi:ketosteroid isomerase-like protein
MKEQPAIDVREFIQEYFDAWRDGITEKILSYYSDDVVINLLGGPALLEGKAAVAENFVLPFTKAFPVMSIKSRIWSIRAIRS